MGTGAAKPTRVNATQAAASEQGSAATGRQASQPSGDAATLSRLARAVAEPSLATPRIESLRRDVKSGFYEVPAPQLASKIVDFLKE